MQAARRQTRAFLGVAILAAATLGFLLADAPQAYATHGIDPPNGATVSYNDPKYVKDGVLTIDASVSVLWDDTPGANFDAGNPRYGVGDAQIPVSGPGTYSVYYIDDRHDTIRSYA